MHCSYLIKTVSLKDTLVKQFVCNKLILHQEESTSNNTWDMTGGLMFGSFCVNYKCTHKFYYPSLTFAEKKISAQIKSISFLFNGTDQCSIDYMPNFRLLLRGVMWQFSQHSRLTLTL